MAHVEGVRRVLALERAEHPDSADTSMGALDVVCADRAVVSIGTQQRLSPIATSTGLSYLLTGLPGPEHEAERPPNFYKVSLNAFCVTYLHIGGMNIHI